MVVGSIAAAPTNPCTKRDSGRFEPDRAAALLLRHRDLLDALAAELIAKETVTGTRLAEIAAAAGNGAAQLSTESATGRTALGPGVAV